MQQQSTHTTTTPATVCPATTSSVVAASGETVVVVPLGEQERTERIAQLHRESKTLIERTTRILITNAIEAGELLLQQKDILPHGAFTQWIENNKDVLGFGERQAQRYMKIARHKDELLAGQASTMEDALGLLSPSHRTTEKAKTEKAKTERAKTEKMITEKVNTEKAENEKSGKLQSSSTGNTPNLPMKTDTGVGFEASDAVLRSNQVAIGSCEPEPKSDTGVGFDCVFTTRDEREIQAMVSELGMTEDKARQIVAWRKGKRAKTPRKQNGSSLEKGTYRLPSGVRRRVRGEAQGSGVSESEILRRIVALYYHDTE